MSHHQKDSQNQFLSPFFMEAWPGCYSQVPFAEVFYLNDSPQSNFSCLISIASGMVKELPTSVETQPMSPSETWALAVFQRAINITHLWLHNK